jgi:hypothetical protein
MRSPLAHLALAGPCKRVRGGPFARTGAILAYRHYLVRRTDPDPALAP